MALFTEATRETETPTTESETPISPETTSSEPSQQEAQEPVAIPVPKPLSRRAQAAEDLKSQVARQIKDSEDRFRSELSGRDAELSRLRSELAMRPVHLVQQQAPATRPEAPDPEKLMREANEALDRKDLDGYHRKLREATRAEVMREWEPRFAQQQAPVAHQQQQLDPQMVAILAQYPDVAAAQNGIQLAIVEDAKLHHLGHQPGIARVNAAFAAARATLQIGRQPGRAQYDTNSAAVLGGAPTGRGSGASAGGSQPSIMMSPDEERTMRMLAKKAGMTWDEYVSDLATHRPEMVRR